ncbi:ABC transporter substrate-binding protein, partial [Paraburkholderia sp. BR14320]
MTTGSQRVQTPEGLRYSVIHGPLRAAFAVALLCASLLAAPHAHAAHAIAQYGEPKYPAGFQHFDYVNPNAPKGGTLVLANPSRLTSFDKFNPFTLRGNAAPGLELMFESLTIGSSDEVASAYGLLADNIVVAPDGLSVTFHINPR